MGEIIKTWVWWWNFMQQFFLPGRILRGQMALGYGVQSYVIQTPQGVPQTVSVSVEEPPDANTVCMGNINLAGAKLMPDGFILYANIQSDTCIVTWIVEFETPPVFDPRQEMG